MTNPLAIAAVTATLRDLLFRRVRADVPGTQVTTRPIDRARNGVTGNQVNLFLYQTTLDAAWRNMDLPNQVLPLETGTPPLPLVLHYLLTAYSDDDAGVVSHRLLGQAMSALHDHPLLAPAEIAAAAAAELQTDLRGEDLHAQLERVRITAMPLSLEEMSKLWTTFQTQYRISAAYEVAVLLIESRQPVRAPLPVLARGSGDRGPVAQADVVPPFPTLEEVALPDDQPSVRPGENLTLRGHHLGGPGTTVAVRFSTSRRAAPVSVPPPDLLAASEREITVTLPGDRPDELPPGFYTVRVVVARSGEADQASNELPLMVAPTITTPLPLTVTRDPATGLVGLQLRCSPPVLPDQRVDLLLGERQHPAAPRTTAIDQLDFSFVAARGDTGGLLRLRVDGVDSQLVDRSGEVPVFLENQRVIIQ
jgi:hypothetical protein